MPTLKVQALYEAAFDRTEPRRLPTLLSSALGGRSAVVAVIDAAGGVDPICWDYFDDQMVAEFQRYVHLDPWSAAVGEMQPPAVARLSDLVPTSDYQRSAFYNEFVRAAGDDTAFGMVGMFPVGDALGVLGVHRGAEQGDFQIEQQQGLTAAMPAITTLLQARSRLEIAERRVPLLEATIDAWPRAILHIDQHRRLAFANGAGEAVLRQGLILRDKAGRILGFGPHAAKLEAALDAALVRGVGGALVLQLADTDVWVTIAPLYSAHAGATMALVSIDTPDATDLDAEAAYMAYFRLTKAEAAIAVGLVSGKTLEEISVERSSQVWTARTQVRAIMQKTGARRQAQLVGILKGMPKLPRGAEDVATRPR